MIGFVYSLLLSNAKFIELSIARYCLTERLSFLSLLFFYRICQTIIVLIYVSYQLCRNKAAHLSAHRYFHFRFFTSRHYNHIFIISLNLILSCFSLSFLSLTYSLTHSLTHSLTFSIQKSRSRLNEQKEKRKSYAGKEHSSNGNLSHNSIHERQRRRSMADMLNYNTPERVIQRMNFGFTVDLPSDTASSRSRKTSGKVQLKGHEEAMDGEFFSGNDAEHVIHTLRSLNEEDIDPQEIDFDAVEMTNQALNMEKEYLNNFSKDFSDVTEDADKFAKIMNVTTNHDALMAYYYLDEKKRVKVTEIFNIPEDMEEAISAGGRTKNTFVDDCQSDRFQMYERDEDCLYSSLDSTGSSKESYQKTRHHHRRKNR